MDYDKNSSKAFIQTFDLPPYQSGDLTNLTFAVKDLIDVAGYKTGCGNPDWEESHSPAVTSAICIEQLLQSGAFCCGKTITDELAFSLLGENVFYGTPVNPSTPDRVPGGSSSGSASAVACGIVDFAIGTDTGGSVRVPASNCGILGLRPTHGHISVAGVMPFAPSFDTVGIFAKEGSVLEKVATVLLGLSNVPSFLPEIFILEDAFAMSDPEIFQCLQKPLEKIRAFTFTSELSLKNIFQDGISYEDLRLVYRALQWSEIWNSLGGWIEDVHPRMGPRISINFEHVRNFDRKQIQKNIQQRTKIKKELNQFLGSNRLLCIPTTPSLAPLKGSSNLDRTKDDYYMRLARLTALSGLASLPQITLPLASFNSIPIGISLLASSGNDEFLIQCALKILK